jgi:hypothetical protein
MPTVATNGPYRLFFFSSDGGEPPHVHVERDDCVAKFWLLSVRAASNAGFSVTELRRIRRMIQSNRQFLIERWNEYFDR